MPDDYGSVAMSDKHQSISKEISKGISYLDVVSRFDVISFSSHYD